MKRASRADAAPALLSRLSVRREPSFDAAFPAEQPAALRLRMRGADAALRFEEALAKLARFAKGATSPARTAEIQRLTRGFREGGRRPICGGR